MRQNNSQPLDVAIVGAGISGLCTAIKLRESGIDNFTIFERRQAVGGTWRDNTYPGAACDIPAMFYQFSFEMKTDWSRKYPQQPEILAYLKHCADKYGLRPHIRFGVEIEAAEFDAEQGLWQVRTADGTTVSARVLVTGTGQLHRPAWPKLDGIEDFRGTSFHSAEWDHEHDFTGERVAVIGNGASAIQFIPELAGVASHLTVLQRSPNWMVGRSDRRYTRLEHWLFRRVPGVARALRWWLYLKHEIRWPVFGKTRGATGRLFEAMLKWQLKRQVPDPALRRKLIPDYPAGCKRVLISDDYYPTLMRDDVDLVDTPITRIGPNGPVTEDGTEHAVDSIVYATGFKTTQFLTPMAVRGLDGADLHATWGSGAEAYLGMAVPGFPNFFMMYGPNTNLGHNSIIFMIEQQAKYVATCVRVIRDRRLRYLDLTEAAMQRWSAEAQGSLAKTVWATSCESWYKTADGKITNNWPYSTPVYWWRLRQPALADYHQVRAGDDSGGLSALRSAKAA